MRNIGRLGKVFAILFCPVSYSKFNELKFKFIKFHRYTYKKSTGKIMVTTK